jgi:DNA-binding LacI/PurR family transcriptional regulator
MKQLLRENPDGVFTASDQMALGAMRAIKEKFWMSRGYFCDRICDFPMASPAHPALTTLRQPIAQFCFEALKMLISLVEDGLEPYRRVILQSEFVIRDSTRDRR